MDRIGMGCAGMGCDDLVRADPGQCGYVRILLDNIPIVVVSD